MGKRLAIRERLERGFAILEMIQRRRIQEGSPKLGWAIERAVVDRELRELEGDSLCGPVPEVCLPLPFPQGFRLGAGLPKLDVVADKRRGVESGN
jgi:hypothetical protein